ncbi:jg728, partial [Pararge aegeria aegeria]
KNKLLTCTR